MNALGIEAIYGVILQSLSLKFHTKSSKTFPPPTSTVHILSRPF
jgi:hypothetical protein